MASQEIPLGALVFVLNAIYMDAAFEQMRMAGQTVEPADIAHLTPLGHAHIRVEGRYRFALTPGLAPRPTPPAAHAAARGGAYGRDLSRAVIRPLCRSRLIPTRWT